jgi:vacuolar-type H+-ATPase subunit F/Vma7
MIVFGNPEFSLGMLLAGVRNSHAVSSREQVIERLRELPEDEFIIANASIREMVPELGQFRNVVTIPDSVEGFTSVDDLQELIKSVVGIELEV